MSGIASLVAAIAVAIALVAYPWLIRGGTTARSGLKCVNPLTAWLQLASGPGPEIRIRVSLTFFLTAARAKSVHVTDMLLRVRTAGSEFETSLVAIADVGGYPWPDNKIAVTAGSVTEVIAEFASEESRLVDVLRVPDGDATGSIEVQIDGAERWKRVASLVLIRSGTLAADGRWQRVDTKRT